MKSAPTAPRAPVAARKPRESPLVPLLSAVEKLAEETRATARDAHALRQELLEAYRQSSAPRPRGKWRFTVNRDEHGRITTIEVEPQ